MMHVATVEMHVPTVEMHVPTVETHIQRERGMREEGQGEALTSVGMLGRELQAAGAELGSQRALQDGGGARALGAAQQLRAARRAAQRQRREHALHVCAQTQYHI